MKAAQVLEAGPPEIAIEDLPPSQAIPSSNGLVAVLLA
jgi:hypothetical protein